MAKDMSDHARDAVQHLVREVAKNVGDVKPDKSMLSGGRGVVAGAGLAALAPLAKKGFDAVRSNGGPSLPSPKPTKIAAKAASKVGDRVGSKVKDEVGSKIDDAGGAGGMAKQAAGGLLPFGGGNDNGGGSADMAGVGKGRRMPVQQSVDVAVPLETAYNQWTQFEEWPNFMHRVTRVTQEDECTVSFATKIWGKTKEFVAEIDTQRPDERIRWKVTQGITHTGVVTFHELAPQLTRIELNVDVDPGSLIEKAARGMRHIKRAMRGDLHRFKAYIEMQELETGAWRGVIEEGELVEEHDPAYDEGREYSDADDFFAAPDDEHDDEEEQDEEAEEEEEAEERPRARARSQSQRSASSRSSSGGGRSGSSRSKSSGSRSGSGSSKARSSSRSGSSSNGKGSANGRSSSSRSKSSNGRSSSGAKKKSSSRS